VARNPFGPWTPDLNPHLVQGGGLLVARNVLPSPDGYKQFPGLTPLSSFTLPFRPKSAIRVLTSGGASEFFAGFDDETVPTAPVAKLYRLTENGWIDVSNAIPYQALGVTRWGFAQFSRFVIACQRGADTSIFEIGRSATFEPIRGHVPRARHATVAENFLWLGDLVDPVEGVLPNAVAWGPLGSPQDWPAPGSDEATQVQSGNQILEGDGGAVQAVIAGAEVVAIFQEGAIWRADYVGNDIVWQLNRVVPDNGLLIKDAAIQFERGVFFIANDGFRIFNFTSSTNIGKGRVNDWFFADYDESYPDSVTVTRCTCSTRIFVSYAGAGNVGGVPNRVLVWDWMLDRFSFAEVTHAAAIGVQSTVASLDAPDTPSDPNLLGDAQPYGLDSFDDRPIGQDQVSIGAFDSTYRLSRFTGVGLEATLETGDIEFFPGRRALLKGVAPNLGSDEVTIQVAGLPNRNDPEPVYTFGDRQPLQEDGYARFEVDWRYHRLRFNLGRSFTPATAYDVDARPTGRF
jgi:hypothetical protein